MTDRLGEALAPWQDKMPTEGFFSTEHASGIPAIRLALIHEDGGAEELASLFLDDQGVQRIVAWMAAARAWHTLTSGELIEADLWEIRPADTDLIEYVVLLADKVPGHTWPKRVVLVDALTDTAEPEGIVLDDE